MKNLLLGMLSLLLLIGTVQAQDAKKAFKSAKKALGNFNLDQTNNRAELKTAVADIKVALEDSEYQADPDSWLLKGDIYNAIASQIIAIKELNFGDEKELPEVDNPALTAKDAYMKSMEMAEKRYQTKDAIKGLQNVQGNLSQFGIFSYEAQKYEEAYKCFTGSIAIHELLKKEGEASTLDAEDNFQYQEYLSGLAALNGEMMDKAAMHFKKLYEQEYDMPAIYEAMYKLEAEKDMDAAYVYLDTGRKKYPDDVSLLFAEINHFLKTGRLEELIGKLKAAIEKEPNNLSIYTTLGNVYDQLYQKEYKAGNMDKSSEYFEEAKKYYGGATEIDETYFDAVYSIGALYYNKAAFMAQELNELGKDLSKEGMKKYDAKREELLKEFDLALPYFQKAEKLDPNDLNTLIALKEIYAKKDNFEMSNEFKDRLDTVQGGGKVESSYFKN